METQELVKNIEVFLKKRKSSLEPNNQTVEEEESKNILKPVGIVRPLLNRMTQEEKEAHSTTIRELVMQEEAMEAQFLMLCKGAYNNLREKLNIRQLARQARMLFEHHRRTGWGGRGGPWPPLGKISAGQMSHQGNTSYIVE